MPASIPVGEILAGTAVAGIATAGVLTYAALSAGSQIFGRTLIAGPNVREIALTFDDGPNDPYTQQLLDVLDRRQIKATFFMIGRYVRRRPDIVRAVQAAGHLIGNHTMTHPWLAFASPRRVRQELADCNAALEDVLARKVEYWRPPHGARRPDVLRAAHELGLKPVMWNVMAYDWKPENDASAIQRYLLRGIEENQSSGIGSNLLLHDGGDRSMGQDRSATVKAVHRLLGQISSDRAEFITVNRLGDQ